MLKILEDSSFFQLLQLLDKDSCQTLKNNGCLRCGGKLDAGHYQRKPRGIEWATLNSNSTLRYSLCCREEGCRKRVSPLSLRFASRKVYCSLFIVLFALLRERGDMKAQNYLRIKFQLSRTTARRWLRMFKSCLSLSLWARDMRSLGVFLNQESNLISAYYEAINLELSLVNRWTKILAGLHSFWPQLL